MDRNLAVLFAAVLVIGLLLRSITLLYVGFYEPDVFFYYGVMKQTVANSLAIPNPLPLSGFPGHNSFSEMPGLIYLIVYPYALLSGLGLHVSIYDILRLMPLLFGLAEMLLTYLLTYALTRNKYASLLSMLIIALLPASIVRTQATEWRGETFIPSMLALILLISIGFSKTRPRSAKGIAYLTAMIVLLAIALYSWSGSAYILAVLGLYLLGLFMNLRMKSLMKTTVVLIAVTAAAWIFGWTLMPYLDPSYYHYLQLNSNLFKVISETQPPNEQNIVENLSIVPVFAALGVLYILLGRRTKETSHSAAEFAYTGTLANLLVTSFLLYAQVRWSTLAAMPMAILAGYGVYRASKWLEGRFSQKAEFILVSFFITITAMMCLIEVLPPPATSQGSISAAGWISANTGANSTFLSGWEDGSAIEGWGNRTVYIDSVDQGQNATRIMYFTHFLFAQRYNFTFLEELRPSYLVIDDGWLAYPNYLETEGGISNTTDVNDTNLYVLAEPNATALALPHDNVSLRPVYSEENITIYELNYTGVQAHS